MKILIVDDDPDGLYMLEAMLKSYGYEVMAALRNEEYAQSLGADRFIIKPIEPQNLFSQHQPDGTLSSEFEEQSDIIIRRSMLDVHLLIYSIFNLQQETNRGNDDIKPVNSRRQPG